MAKKKRITSSDKIERKLTKIKKKTLSKGFWIRVSLSAFIIIATVVTFILCGGLYVFDAFKPNDNYTSQDFEVHYIDVGQGDATLIKLPDDKLVLIDTGEATAGETLVNYISSFMNNKRFKVIDYLIFTHQDTDHIGSGKKVLEEFQVNCVYRPMQLSQYEILNNLVINVNYPASTSKTYSSLIEMVYKEPNCEMRYSQMGESIVGDRYEFDFLSPWPELINDNTKNNNFSPIIMLEYNSKKFLFTGDAESIIENKVAEKYGYQLKADVYKVGHHGSDTSSKADFLKKVNPTYSVISVGENNQYNLPNNKVIERLKNVGSQIMMTAELGTIIFAVNENFELVILSHTAPKYDVVLIVVIGFVLLMMVWGIKIKKKKRQRK